MKSSSLSKAKPAARFAAKTSASTSKRAAHQPVFAGRNWAVELLDTQAHTVLSVADYQLRAARLHPAAVGRDDRAGQADVLVSVTDAYVSAARRLLVK